MEVFNIHTLHWTRDMTTSHSTDVTHNHTHNQWRKGSLLILTGTQEYNTIEYGFIMIFKVHMIEQIKIIITKIPPPAKNNI